MHDTLCFTSHERFPDSFTSCVHTLCCMIDQDLFWHLWKLIIFESTELLSFNHIILYLWDSCIFMGSCVLCTGTQVLLNEKQWKGYRKESGIQSNCILVQWHAVWPPVVIDLFWCLLLSVYSPLRIQAYIIQLKSKYKKTIDVYIVQAWFKESILKINAIE